MFKLNENPKVSIIMPTYNRANYILESIKSIQEQTHRNWELIIIDDGSDDNTQELITQVAETRIQFHKLERTAVVGRIKNFGLRKASGELIAFQDSDDLWPPQKLEKQIEALRQYPEAGFSLTGGYNFRILSQPLEYFYKQRDGIKYGDILISIFRSEVSMLTQSLLFRRPCLETAGYFNEDKPFSDSEFILNLAIHFKAVILYEQLFFRRIHDDNHNAANWEDGYDQKIAIIDRARKEQLVPVKILQSAAFHLYINFGESYLRRNNPKKAIGKFFIAWRNKPFSIVPLKKSVKAIIRFVKP
jgi:glycosyltransferase involved in cell wall biosynthesis